ncbi:MAG: hypothetical protein HFE83_03505 [Lachnospiraceae bacterium]|jgi:hypothetical protein|nr:hypothetical protein [Lachnospiraceae bacterium]
MSEPYEIDSDLLSFLEAKEAQDYNRMLSVVTRLSRAGKERELDSICTALDMPALSDTAEKKAAAITGQLLLQQKFDGGRLR